MDSFNDYIKLSRLVSEEKPENDDIVSGRWEPVGDRAPSEAAHRPPIQPDKKVPHGDRPTRTSL